MPEIAKRTRDAKRGADGLPLEGEIHAAIRLALGKVPDLVLWRNSIARPQEWDPKTGRTRVLHAGLPIGSADLVGILKPGRFIALEVKTESGRVTDEQRQWLALVQMYGGFAAIVRSVDEALEAVARARRGDLA